MKTSDFPNIQGYTPLKKCGQGAYGSVWIVKDFSGREVALKIIDKNALGDCWQREYYGLITYRQKIKKHINLVEIYHIEDRDSFFYYTMELADNLADNSNYIPSTFDNWVQRYGALEYDNIVFIFNHILDGIKALHAEGLIHRDIKPENIIFVDNIPKLSDIGLMTSHNKSLSLVGTQAFMAPELLADKKVRVPEQIDLYALGKTLYIALTGNSVDAYPSIEPIVLRDARNKLLNHVIKTSCHPSASCRFNSAEEFQSALNGEFKFRYILFSFIHHLLIALGLPFILFINSLLYIWRKPVLRSIAIFAFLTGSVFFVHKYLKYMQLKYRNSMGILSKDEEEEYYRLIKQDNVSMQEKQRLQEIKDKVQRFRSSADINNFSSEKKLNKQKKNTKIYSLHKDSFNGWLFKNKKDISIDNGIITFWENADCDMALADLKLPNDYKITFSLHLKQNSLIQFLVYSPESLRLSDSAIENNLANLDNCSPASYYWSIKNGQLGNFMMRCYGSGGFKYHPFGKHKQPTMSLGNNKQLNIAIQKTDSIVRIYCNDKLLYSPVGNVFNGGRFRIRVSERQPGSNIKISNLCIFDVSP